MSADITVRRGDIECDTHTVEVDLTSLLPAVVPALMRAIGQWQWGANPHIVGDALTFTLDQPTAAHLAEQLTEAAAPPSLCQRPAATRRGPYGRAEACDHFAVEADDSCRCHGGGGGL